MKLRDVVLGDIDEKKTRKHPDNRKDLINFHYSLSTPPFDEEWFVCFDEVRKERAQNDPSTPAVSRSSGGIVLSCDPNELFSHDKNLRKDVVLANRKYRQVWEERERARKEVIDVIDEAIKKLKG
jgi:hypothetical protein